MSAAPRFRERLSRARRAAAALAGHLRLPEALASDRAIATLSFAAAFVFHAGLLYMATRQYLSASAHPERANAAAQALLGGEEKPYRFVYVKDINPSKEPPLDPARLSDVQRRGSSPDGGSGTSPDPTSFGNNPERKSGGIGALRPPPPQSPPLGASAPGQGPSPSPGEGTPPKGPKAASELGLPVGGEERGDAKGKGKAPQGASPGLTTGLREMYLGAMEGGFHNPNASRLNSGSVSFDTAGWDLGPYARQVQERVKGNWRIPQAQEVLRQKGWVSIHFSVRSDGSIEGLKVIRPSGIPSYDQAALNALRSSNPLPLLPPEVTVPEIHGTFRFFYNMPIPEDEE